MIGVTFLCVGRLKEPYLRDGMAEYAKRLSPFCDFDVVEVAEERLPDDPSPAAIDAALRMEAETLLARIPERAKVYVLAIEGKGVDSPGFARILDDAMNAGASRLIFVIGGSHGLAPEVKRAAAGLLSFSALTFPHQLMRLIAIEQVYRAFTILHHRAYHK